MHRRLTTGRRLLPAAGLLPIANLEAQIINALAWQACWRLRPAVPPIMTKRFVCDRACRKTLLGVLPGRVGLWAVSISR